MRARRGGEQRRRASPGRSLSRRRSLFPALAHTGTHPRLHGSRPARTHLHFPNEPLDGCQRRGPGGGGRGPRGEDAARDAPSARPGGGGGLGREKGRLAGAIPRCPRDPETWAGSQGSGTAVRAGTRGPAGRGPFRPLKPPRTCPGADHHRASQVFAGFGRLYWFLGRDAGGGDRGWGV